MSSGLFLYESELLLNPEQAERFLLSMNDSWRFLLEAYLDELCRNVEGIDGCIDGSQCSHHLGGLGKRFEGFLTGYLRDENSMN